LLKRLAVTLASADKIQWPEGRQFAFTVFDDPDSQSLASSQAVYGFLAELGFRTTKGVWPLGPTRKASDHGATCEDTAYLAHVQALQERGFEIGFHNATSHTSLRDETTSGLRRFREYFGSDAITMSNHYNSGEGIYFGSARISSWNRVFYDALTLGRNRHAYRGHVPGDPCFWGDLCQQYIRYVRNFAFLDLNTLGECPYMPYHDPDRPFVRAWYASSVGANANRFLELVSERNQDRLEEQAGAAIVYTHFAHGFVEDGSLSPQFRQLMTRLARKNGWFVPVGTLLGLLEQNRGLHRISKAERSRMERRWLWEKVRTGTN